MICVLVPLAVLAGGCLSGPAPRPVEARLVEADDTPLLGKVVPAVRADGVPLERVLSDLSTQAGVAIVPNFQALELEGIDRNTPISIDAGLAMPLGRALDLVLSQAGGGFADLVARERGNVVVVTTREADRTERTPGLYPVADLLSDMRRAAEAFPDSAGGVGADVPAGLEVEVAAPPAEERLVALVDEAFPMQDPRDPPRIETRLETGILIVQASAADHERIGRLLTLYRDTLREQLRAIDRARP